MAQVIRAFQPQADLRQVPESDLPALYHSVLSDKRALLLLDNARDAAQVKLLLPPATCAVIVTSRRHFVLPGLQPLRLDVLNAQDAADLLLSISPRLGAHAARLAELCACLPLALRIAGGHLSSHADLAPSDYLVQLEAHRLARLVSEDDLDQNVERVLELSYEQLAPEVQARFRALAVFSAPFDIPAAAAVWEMEDESTREILGGLLRYSMIEFDEAARHYHLHDLLRDFADARLTPEEQYAAHLRHSRSYLQVASAASELYLQGRENVSVGLALFDAESAHIRAGQSWVAALAATDDNAARLCSIYPYVGCYIFSIRLHPRVWADWLVSALAAARKVGDKRAEGSRLGNLGTAYSHLGEERKAIEYQEQALTIAREIGDQRLQEAALGNLGIAYLRLGDPRKAILFGDQALALARDVGDRQGEASGLSHLGNAYGDLGQGRKAIEYHGQSLALAREIGDRRLEANQLSNLGVAYRNLGEVGKGIEHLHLGLAIVREIGDRRGEANNLGNLGLFYRMLGQLRKAIEYLTQALAIDQEAGDRRGEGNRLGELGNAYYSLSEVRKAIEYY